MSGLPRPSGFVTDDDPLGVRADFPVVEEGIYLDAPYITPSPRQVTAAASAFAEAKNRDPVNLGRMLEETDATRRKFARLVGASEPEIGMLFATSEGENIVARALDLGAGDNVVIDDLHYDTTYVLYQHLAESRGLDVRIVKSEAGGAPVDAFAEQVDFFTTGTYKWLLGGFGVAPFFVREELLELVTVDRFGALHVAEELGGFRYRLHDDGRKFGYATLGFGSVFQLSAALDYLLRVGVPSIERHTVALAHRLHEGLAAQGYDVLTPEGNHSSIVTFEHGREIERIRSAIEAEKIKVSFKEGGRQIRAGAALFNNADEIDALLELTGRLA